MTDRTRKILKWLRIAWTAFFAVQTVLLVVLWVRSYTYTDSFTYQFGNGRSFSALFSRGRFVFVHSDIPSNIGLFGPSFASYRRGRIFIDTPNEPTLNGRWGFLGYVNPTYFRRLVVVIPLWSLALLFALAGTLSIKGLLLYRRFSLRTLLIATTLVAVVLGMAVYFARS